jgi:hypothetical protein
MDTDIRSGKLIDAFDEACAATYIFSEKRDYLYGRSFLALAVNPVPRRFWQNKPVGFGYTLAQELFETGTPPTNLGPSIEGELFANGGLIAVIVGMAILGFLCKWYDSLLLGPYKNQSSLLLHSLGLYQFFFLVRGDFLDAAYAFLISVIPLFVLFCLPLPSLETRPTRPIRSQVSCKP